MRWLCRLTGGLLMVLGLVPLTPLIFLLALVPGDAGRWLDRAHLQIWQTQGTGLILALAGALLMRRGLKA